MTNIQIPGSISGYALSDDYLAQRSKQGGRVHYSIILPLHQVPITLPVPDPTEPYPDNREVSERHAKRFAEYIRDNEGWHAGSLTIRGLSRNLAFSEFEGQGDRPVKIGLLKVPRNNRNAFRIIDGQHRILGLKLLFELISDDENKGASQLSNARKIGAEPGVIAQFERELLKIDNLKQRLALDTMTVDLVEVDSEDEHKQIFVDVANNALSVQKAVTARFDQSKVVNRAVISMLGDPSTDDLIRNRIDEQRDRVGKSKINLIGSGFLGEIIRVVRRGIVGRMSAADEKMLDHMALAADANRFFAVLRESFGCLSEVANDIKTPAEIRGQNLIGSTTMIKIIAGVYHELVKTGVTRARIVSFLQAIDKSAAAPLDSSTPNGRLWITSPSGGFREGDSAPTARMREVAAIVDEIVAWYSNPPIELGWK